MWAMTEPLTYTVPQAADALGVSHRAVYQAVRAGQLPALRIGKFIRIPREALASWVSATAIEEARARKAM